MSKITRKDLKKFDAQLTYAKDCEHAFSCINELVRLSFQIADRDLGDKVLDSLNRCYDDIFEHINVSLPVGADEK